MHEASVFMAVHGARRSWGRAILAVAMVAASVSTTADEAGADVNFNLTELPLGSRAGYVAVGDFDGNLLADFVVTKPDIDTVAVRLGLGNGTFSSAPDVAVGDQPQSVAVGDFNGDGKADLAVPSWGGLGPWSVAVRLGNGSGGFISTHDVPLPAPGVAVAVGDFDRDGRADLAVANRSDRVSVRLGLGDGTFLDAPDVGAGVLLTSLAVADFNADGKADLAVTKQFGTGVVHVRLGVGDGTFTNAPDVEVGGGPRVAVADFNGDGKDDLVTANYFSEDLDVRLGVGDGTFTVAPDRTFKNTTGPSSVAVGDFNADAKADIAVPMFRRNRVVVEMGVGDGTFTALTSAGPTGAPDHLAVGDFTGDDGADLVVANGAEFNTATVAVNLDPGAPTAPTCRIRARLNGPPKEVVVRAVDLRSGIRLMAVSHASNATVRIEPFASVGHFAPGVAAVATKVDPSQVSQVAFVATDNTGRQASCV